MTFFLQVQEKNHFWEKKRFMCRSSYLPGLLLRELAPSSLRWGCRASSGQSLCLSW